MPVTSLALDAGSGCGLVPTLLRVAAREEAVFLLLDTGAARTTVDLGISVSLGLEVKTRGTRIDIHRVGGIVDGWLIPIEIELAGVRLEREIQFTDFGTHFLGNPPRRPGFQGLLGNDLLRAANLRAVIDVPRNRAVLATHDLR